MFYTKCTISHLNNLESDTKEPIFFLTDLNNTNKSSNFDSFLFILVSVCDFPHCSIFHIDHIALRNKHLKVKILCFYDNPRLSQNYEMLCI